MLAPGPADAALEIDWIEPGLLGGGLPGRLGMTILPGKRGPSIRYPGRVYRRDLARDLGVLRTAGVRRLILLIDDGELARWAHPELTQLAGAAGIEVVRAPMPDGGTPRDVTEMDRILGLVTTGRVDGDVAVACMGGIGRTGTVAACALVRAGLTAEQAIALVRDRRHPEAVETAAQVAFVGAYADRPRSRSG